MSYVENKECISNLSCISKNFYCADEKGKKICKCKGQNVGKFCDISNTTLIKMKNNTKNSFVKIKNFLAATIKELNKLSPDFRAINKPDEIINGLKIISNIFEMPDAIDSYQIFIDFLNLANLLLQSKNIYTDDIMMDLLNRMCDRGLSFIFYHIKGIDYAKIKLVAYDVHLILDKYMKNIVVAQSKLDFIYYSNQKLFKSFMMLFDPRIQRSLKKIYTIEIKDGGNSFLESFSGSSNNNAKIVMSYDLREFFKKKDFRIIVKLGQYHYPNHLMNEDSDNKLKSNTFSILFFDEYLNNIRIPNFHSPILLAIPKRPLYFFPEINNSKTKLPKGNTFSCYFFDEHIKKWSIKNVRLPKVNESTNYYYCETRHFTSFAIRYTEKSLDELSEVAKNYVETFFTKNFGFFVVTFLFIMSIFWMFGLDWYYSRLKVIRMKKEVDSIYNDNDEDEEDDEFIDEPSKKNHSIMSLQTDSPTAKSRSEKKKYLQMQRKIEKIENISFIFIDKILKKNYYDNQFSLPIFMYDPLFSIFFTKNGVVRFQKIWFYILNVELNFLICAIIYSNSIVYKVI